MGATSVDFTLASYTPPSSSEESGSGSSGGASISTKNGPQTNDGKVITAASMYLGDNSGYTTEKTINVRFATNNAALIALSTDATFADATYEPAKTSYELTLPSAYGTYTVYAKLRSPEGGISVLSKKITYTTPKATGDTTDTPTDISSDTCVLKEGKPYKAGNATAVYYVTDSCTKRPFQTAERYFEYFLSWNAVTVVHAKVLGAVANDPAGYMPHGPLYTPLANTLIKATTDPKVYLFSGNTVHWIVSETIFNTLGYTWNKIEQISTSFFERFTRGEDLTQTHLRPNGTLIKYDYSPRVYRLNADPEDNTKQIKRWIHDKDTFISLHYRWQDIISVNEAETYPNGEEI